MSDAIRSILVEAQNRTYHEYDQQLKELAQIPGGFAVAIKLTAERDYVFNEFQKRIDALTK